MNHYLNNARKKDVLTKFLTIEEQKELEHARVKYKLSGQGEERKRAYLFHGEVFDDIDFEIQTIEVTYNKKFYNLTHPMVLGALMGLGITRDCIGDIIIADVIYIMVVEEMASFIINNLNVIDKASVRVKSVDERVVNSYDPYLENTIIVSSLRLDVIVSSITNFSREKAKTYIQMKEVKINGQTVEQIDYQVKIGDLISIHRFGRTILKEIIKKTKKDKFVLLVKQTK